MNISSNSYVIEQAKEFSTSGTANAVENAGQYLVPTLEKTTRVKRVAVLVESATLADLTTTLLVLNFNSVDAIITPLIAHAPAVTNQEQIYYDVDIPCGSNVNINFQSTKAVAVKVQVRFIFE